MSSPHLRQILSKTISFSTHHQQHAILPSSSSLLFNNQVQSSQHVFTQSRQVSNRSRRGLYDGKDIRSGNNLSFSMNKTKRKFKPNVFKKKVYSEILDEMIQFHLTTSALRTIDKVGGLDNYLLTSRHVKEGKAWTVKQRLLQKVGHCKQIGKDVLPPISLPSRDGGNMNALNGEEEEVSETADGETLKV
mmetsp:Transcript_15132/g.18437  ORF Transcript_15132/g.18437 Transcript_15132/m.18437 type:complete len:190 (-) Transcript_15132:179-748(-)